MKAERELNQRETESLGRSTNGQQREKHERTGRERTNDREERETNEIHPWGIDGRKNRGVMEKPPHL
jgi:hypothetical protein